MHEQRKSPVERLRGVTLSLLDGSRPVYSLRSKVLELKSTFEASGGLKADTTEGIARGETDLLVIEMLRAALDTESQVAVARYLHHAAARPASRQDASSALKRSPLFRRDLYA